MEAQARQEQAVAHVPLPGTTAAGQDLDDSYSDSRKLSFFLLYCQSTHHFNDRRRIPIVSVRPRHTLQPASHPHQNYITSIF